MIPLSERPIGPPLCHHHCLFSNPAIELEPLGISNARDAFIAFRSFLDLPSLCEPHYIFMRLPRFSSFVRTFIAFSNVTSRTTPQRILTPPSNTLLLRSMPSIPFLSSLFGTSAPAAEKMSYPDQRSSEEWQAVLNKGEHCVLPSTMHY